MRKRFSKQLCALAHRAFDLGVTARLDPLDAARALIAATIHLCQIGRMQRRDIADWLRRLAKELDDADAAKVRELMRQQQ